MPIVFIFIVEWKIGHQVVVVEPSTTHYSLLGFKMQRETGGETTGKAANWWFCIGGGLPSDFNRFCLLRSMWTISKCRWVARTRWDDGMFPIHKSLSQTVGEYWQTEWIVGVLVDDAPFIYVGGLPLANFLPNDNDVPQLRLISRDSAGKPIDHPPGDPF